MKMTVLQNIPESFLLLLTLSGFVFQVSGSACSLDNSNNGTICANITTSADALQAAQYLAKVTQESRILIIGSNVDLLPDDFLGKHPVTELYIHLSNMSDIPYRLINPICGTLTRLELSSNTIQSVSPSSGGRFQNCSRLVTLKIYHSTVRITPNVFEGIPNLETLEMFGNDGMQIVDKNTFKSLGKLVKLDLRSNNLTSLPEGVLYPMKYTLRRLDLSDNQFKCSCSLQWLQDWLKEMDSNHQGFISWVACSTPVEGRLQSLHFCTQECTGGPLLKNMLEQALATLRQNCPNL